MGNDAIYSSIVLTSRAMPHRADTGLLTLQICSIIGARSWTGTSWSSQRM